MQVDIPCLQQDWKSPHESCTGQAAEVPCHAGRHDKVGPVCGLGQRPGACLHPEVLEQHMRAPLGPGNRPQHRLHDLVTVLSKERMQVYP